MTDLNDDVSGPLPGSPARASSTGDPDTPTAASSRPSYHQLDDQSARLMRAVPEQGTTTPEQLAVRTGLPLRIVLRRLPLLELADLVHRRDGGVALTKNDGRVDTALSVLVSAYCAAYPGQRLKPYEIARGLTAVPAGRHVGTSAVLNCCLHLVATGHLVQVADAPLAFAFADTGAPADEDQIPQS